MSAQFLPISNGTDVSTEPSGICVRESDTRIGFHVCKDGKESVFGVENPTTGSHIVSFVDDNVAHLVMNSIGNHVPAFMLRRKGTENETDIQFTLSLANDRKRALLRLTEPYSQEILAGITIEEGYARFFSMTKEFDLQIGAPQGKSKMVSFGNRNPDSSFTQFWSMGTKKALNSNFTITRFNSVDGAKEDDPLTISHLSGQIKFNGEYTFPIEDGLDGQVLMTNGQGALYFAHLPTPEPVIQHELSVSGSSAVDYDVEEHATGEVWIDNKPIYRKVIPKIPGPNNGMVSARHGVQGMGTVIECKIMYKDDVTYYPNLKHLDVTINAGMITVTTNLDYSNLIGTAIITYTKTN